MITISVDSIKKSDVRMLKDENLGKYIRLSRNFSNPSRITVRDLNNNTSSPTFYLYSKDDITSYLTNPYVYEKQLRRATTYIYGASSHFRRLIQYFVGLSDFSYIIEPYKIDVKKINTNTLRNNYHKTLNTISSMNVRTQFPKILTTCLREDTFFGTLWVSGENVTVQQLPSDYCAIASIEDNVLNVSFDFSYFDSHSENLEFYPPEFRTKYNKYRTSRGDKWIELDSPTSFAIKCNTDILDYSIPPFAGILREIYDIEDYKQLKLTKTSLENYAILSMKLPLNDDGSWGIDLPKARDFWRNLDAVLPEEVGSVLTPMELNKISFDKSNTGDTNTISDAEQNLFTAAGVSTLLFNNQKASANALSLSIKADQAITYGIVKNIENAINRFIHSQSYGKNFKLNFLDVSPWNRKEAGEAYLKAATYGLPTISMYAASQGLGQAELDNMSFLEGSVLCLQDLFKPIRSSTQMTTEELTGEDGGRPEKDGEALTDSGEQSREDGDDWG